LSDVFRLPIDVVDQLVPYNEPCKIAHMRLHDVIDDILTCTLSQLLVGVACSYDRQGQTIPSSFHHLHLLLWHINKRVKYEILKGTGTGGKWDR